MFPYTLGTTAHLPDIRLHSRALIIGVKTTKREQFWRRLPLVLRLLPTTRVTYFWCTCRSHDHTAKEAHGMIKKGKQSMVSTSTSKKIYSIYYSLEFYITIRTENKKESWFKLNSLYLSDLWYKVVFNAWKKKNRKFILIFMWPRDLYSINDEFIRNKNIRF